MQMDQFRDVKHFLTAVMRVFENCLFSEAAGQDFVKKDLSSNE